MNYGLIGSDKHVSEKVIYDSLCDVYKDNDVVYISDKLIGNETIKKWMEATSPEATFVPTTELFEKLAESKGTLLLMWDEDKPQLMDKYVINAVDAGVKVLDVSNGLTPIVVEGSEPEKKEETKPAEDANKGLTYDELVSLPMAKLKSLANDYGSYTKKLTTKSALAEAILLGNAEKKEEEEDIELPIDLGTFKIVSTTGTTCTVVVVFSDGRVITGQAPEHKVAEVFGFTS
jgi:hypothetical protein